MKMTYGNGHEVAVVDDDQIYDDDVKDVILL